MNEAAVLMMLPYGQSPKTAIVVVAFVQVTAKVLVSAQPRAMSPSDTLSVIVAVPGTVQVKVGFWAVALLNVPELADQEYASAEGPASLSWADDAREIEEPTMTSFGEADTASICGQMLSLPLTRTLPVRTPS